MNTRKLAISHIFYLRYGIAMGPRNPGSMYSRTLCWRLTLDFQPNSRVNIYLSAYSLILSIHVSIHMSPFLGTVCSFLMWHGRSPTPGVPATWGRPQACERGAAGARLGGVWWTGAGSRGLEPLLASLCLPELGLREPAAVATPQPPSQNCWHHTQGDCLAILCTP